MEELFIIGSVVQVKDSKLFILGHCMMEHEGVMKLHYYVVQYPRGFTTVANVGIIPAAAITDVISKGYMNESGKKYLKGMSTINQYINGDTKEVAEHKMQEMTKEIKCAIELSCKNKCDDNTLKGSEA